MKKLFFAASIMGIAFFSTSCKKETTCECKTYEIDDNGDKTQVNIETKVDDSKNADCGKFEDYNDPVVGPTTEIQCEEKVLD